MCGLLIDFPDFICVYLAKTVVSASLLRFSLTRGEEFQELLLGLIFLKGRGSVKFLILREIITVFTCFVQRHLRYIH